MVACSPAELLVVPEVHVPLAVVHLAPPASFLVGGNHEDRERLLDPEVAPGRAGGGVSPPLMRQLVRGEPVRLRVLATGRAHMKPRRTRAETGSQRRAPEERSARPPVPAGTFRWMRGNRPEAPPPRQGPPASPRR